MQINKLGALTLALVVIIGTNIAPASVDARKGLPTIGGGNPVSCDTTIRGVSLTSGGSQAHDQVGLGPDNMHVFIEYSWRPCTNNENLNISVYDHVTGELQPVSFYKSTASIGEDIKGSSFTSNAKFSYQYDVVITTSKSTGEVIQTFTDSIVTDNKL